MFFQYNAGRLILLIVQLMEMAKQRTDAEDSHTLTVVRFRISGTQLNGLR